MYSTKTAIESTGNNYIPAGINDNIKLYSVSVLKSPNGKDYIEFVFKDNEDREATMTEWKNEKGMFIKTDADLQKADDIQFGRILQIIKCYTKTEDVPEIEFNSFNEMIVWVQQYLSEKMKSNSDNPLRLKITFDNKGFLRVSKYGIFVEPMSVKESRIILTGRDKTVRPEIPVDKEDTPKTDPLSSIKATPETEKDDELPF